jgi:hypothetical protein
LTCVADFNPEVATFIHRLHLISAGHVSSQRDTRQ